MIAGAVIVWLELSLLAGLIVGRILANGETPTPTPPSSADQQ